MPRARIGLLALLLLRAGALSSSHGHLGDRNHEQSCSACTAAEARSLRAQPIPLLPAPLATLLVAAPICRTHVAHGRSPLEAAPKHGPPASSVQA